MAEGLFGDWKEEMASEVIALINGRKTRDGMREGALKKDSYRLRYPLP